MGLHIYVIPRASYQGRCYHFLSHALLAFDEHAFLVELNLDHIRCMLVQESKQDISVQWNQLPTVRVAVLLISVWINAVLNFGVIKMQ